MIFRLGSVRLRKAETRDLEALYQLKNDPEVADLLGGFSRGYSMEDIVDWMEYHREQKDEALWVIVDSETDECLGHVGLYRLDYRVRSAEFAILLGARKRWGQGIGREVSRFIIDYGFKMLNLNRIELAVLEHNSRARRLYHSLGFQEEGVARQARYKNGRYLNVVLMGLLREEYMPGGQASVETFSTRGGPA